MMVRRRKLLIVDDNEDITKMLDVALSRANFDTTFAHGGFAALTQIFAAYDAGSCFDAILLDCAMPRCDGFAVAKLVRETEGLGIVARTRISFLTAYPETVERTSLLREVDYDHYWEKSDRFEELPRAIAAWMGECSDV